jgi:hypothetical protein
MSLRPHLGRRLPSENDRNQIQAQGLRQRWEIESLFSGLTGATGSAQGPRKDITRHHEAGFRVLAYTLNRR